MAQKRCAAAGHHELPYCVLLPPHIGPADPVTVRQVINYRGLFGLWTVPLQVPDVVDPLPR